MAKPMFVILGPLPLGEFFEFADFKPNSPASMSRVPPRVPAVYGFELFV